MPPALGADPPDGMNNTQRKMEVDELFGNPQLAYLVPEIARKTKELNCWVNPQDIGSVYNPLGVSHLIAWISPIHEWKSDA